MFLVKGFILCVLSVACRQTLRLRGAHSFGFIPDGYQATCPAGGSGRCGDGSSDELERVETFKYLGRFLTMDNNEIVAVCSNLKKARKCWNFSGSKGRECFPSSLSKVV